VARPSRYEIPRYDFRLSDAIATAGGIAQFNVSYIYVSRPVTGEEVIAGPEVVEPPKPKEQIEPRQEMLEIIAPRAKGRSSENSLIIASSEMATDKELAELALPEGFEPLDDELSRELKAEDLPESSVEPTGREMINSPINPDQTGRIEWIFQDGKWLPIQVGRPAAAEVEAKAIPGKPTGPLKEQLPQEFGWDQIGTGGIQRRVIKIPADRLLSGEPRYNIVIRSSDSIHVPVDIIGEFCIMGNVNAQGYINLSGRPMTLKMAIAAAGGLGPLAWPRRCEVIRRIGKDREEIVMVDLDKIARGEQPDFFIKANDLVNVGTHSTSRWRAVLRNSFRATYGFGFVYDRNFADRDYGTRRPIPNWF
jgi:protein involved in polysaccharide export with SLBB domain